MQLDLIISASGENGSIKQAHLRPISKYINYAPVVDERIMDRPHQLNIKCFYEKTRSGFYSQPYDPRLKSDWPMMISAAEMPDLKYIKEFDDTYFAGCQRMSHKLYGCTHEILVPVWLDHCYGLRFNIFIGNDQPRYTESTRTKQHKIVVEVSKEYLAKHAGEKTFHYDFTKYLMDYFDYVGITKGSNNVMSINFKQNMSTISGLMVESGNVTVRQNLNIAKNLLFRERPLLESNSLITNTFMDYKMITTQLINFNLCVDFSNLFRATAIDTMGGFERPVVWVEVKYIKADRDRSDIVYYDEPDFEAGTGYGWETLPLADFYTNHEYIPKQMVRTAHVDGAGATYNDNDYPRNVLDYKMDFACTDIMHQNKMSQSICHWYYADDPEGITFNLYNGFGAYDPESGQEYSHGIGATLDPNDSSYDKSLDNTIWCGGPARVNSEQSLADILNAPWKWVDKGYFMDARGYINGLNFAYDEASTVYAAKNGHTAPSAVYLATSITPREFGEYTWWTAQSNVRGDMHQIAIVTSRKSASGVDDMPTTQSNEFSKHDIGLDWHKYSDMDNRFVIYSKSRPGCRAYFDPTGKYLKPGKYVWLPYVNGNHIADNISDKDLGDARNADYKGDITRAMLMRIGGHSDAGPTYRNESNVNGLFISYLRSPINSEDPNRPNNPLFVVFETKATERLTRAADKIVFDCPDSAIVLGGIREALHEYWMKYSTILKMIDIIVNEEGDDIVTPGDIPDMDDLEVIVNLMTNIKPPEVLYFHNGIVRRQDVTLSMLAHEHNYYKTDKTNEYVWRYSGAIKPAIYPTMLKNNSPRVQRKNSGLIYNDWYGRNFLWHKTPIFTIGQSLPVNLARYIDKNIAPCYPSLSYDVVNRLVINDSKRTTAHGDLMYDEIPPIYLGKLVMDRNVVDRGSFSPNDFKFENMDNTDKKFSFSEQIIGQSLYTTDDEGKIIPNSFWGDSTGNWWEWPKYNDLARGALKCGKINPNLLSNRSDNHIAYWLYGNEYSTYEWAEFKWFNQSRIIRLPVSWDTYIEVEDNNKATIEATFFGELLEHIRKTSSYPHLYDISLLRASYDVNYDLQKIEPNPNNPLLYKYNVIATLK